MIGARLRFASPEATHAPPPVADPSPQSPARRDHVSLYYALLLAVVALPLMDLEVFRIGGKSIVASYVALVPLLLLLGARPNATLRALWSDRALPFLVAWLFVALVSVLLVFVQTQRMDVLGANLRQYLNVAIMGAHFALFSAALRQLPPARYGRLLDVVVLVAGAGAVLSCYQFAAVYAGLPQLEFLRTSNLYSKAQTLAPHGGGSWISVPRVYGSAPEPTFWGCYLLAGLGLVLGRISAQPDARRVMLAAVIALAALLTFSRAAALAALLTIPLVAFARRRQGVPRGALYTVLAAAVAATVAPALAGEVLAGALPDLSTIERVSAAVTGLRIVAAHPFLGIGMGSARFYVERYLYFPLGSDQVAFDHMYSFLLSVLVGTGLVGGVLFFAFLVQLAMSAGVGRARRVDPELAGIRTGAALAFASVIAAWLNTGAYNFSYIWFHLALASALPTAAWTAHAGRVDAPGHRPVGPDPPARFPAT